MLSNWFSDNETLVQAALAGTLLAYSFQVALRAGVFTLGGVGFWAIGAYTTAILVTKHGWATAPAIAAGLVLSAVVGLGLAMILGRLRSLYLAMATVSFVLLVQIVAINWDGMTGGAGGLFGIPVTVTTTTLFLVVVVVSVGLVLFERGARGRTIEAMRLDEQLAHSVGIDIVRERHLIFVLASVLAALSGGISAMMFNTMAPEQAGFALIVDTLMMVVIGGASAWWGALVGAVIVTWLPEVLRFTGDYRAIIEGAIVVLVVVYAPEGVVGLVRRLQEFVTGRRRPVATPFADDAPTALPDKNHAQPEASLPPAGAQLHPDASHKPAAQPEPAE
jgi:branched-chain amino acid transport system permease protein